MKAQDCRSVNRCIHMNLNLTFCANPQHEFMMSSGIGINVHAISDRAKRFYERWGFIASPVEPMTLMITLAEGRKAMRDKSA